MTARPRVVLVGPVFPYRGGIAQHTTMMSRALQEIANLMVVSYKRQYPSMLYPGETDKDPSAPEPGLTDLRYTIDSVNPLTWMSAARDIEHYKPDLVVFVWWTFFWAPCVWYMARRLKKSGISLRFFCHNAVEHEASRVKTWLCRNALSQADSFFVHSGEDERNLIRDFPGARIGKHPHPIYSHFPPPSEVLPRRAALELLFFGLVRPYKGLDVLIDAIGLLQDTDVALSVVGEFWSGREDIDRQIAALGLGDRVHIIDRYVSDEEAANHFARADVVVLPYRSATGSGVIPLAYHYRKPVIVTNVGGLPDVVEEGRTGWVVPPNSAEVIAQAVRDLRHENGSPDYAISELVGRLTWESLAREFMQGPG